MPPTSHADGPQPDIRDPAGFAAAWTGALPGARAVVAAMVRDRTAVDDLVQETALAAWRIRDRFDRSRDFAPWVRGIARLVVRAWLRRARTMVAIGDAEAPAPPDEPERDPHERLARMHTGLAGLAAGERALVEGRYLHGRSVRDLAAAHRIAPAVVSVRLYRALRRAARAAEGAPAPA